MPKRSLTIQDIAASAGVSKATVSRYLNGKYQYMSAQTRERIRTVIEVTGYHPNSIARSLKSQRSMVVGLVVADIASPFSSSVVKSIGSAMLGSGYSLMTANSDNDPEREKQFLRSMIHQQVDGLIVNTCSADNPYLIEIANNGMPVVLLDRFLNDYRLDISYIQNHRPMQQAIDHLNEQGYGELGLLVQPFENVSPRALRRSSFINCLAQAGVKAPASHVYLLDAPELDSAKRCIHALLEKARQEGSGRPPALIATNGVSLMYAARAALALGLSMPKDLGLCGYDDWGWAADLGWPEMIGPGLTTLTPSMDQLGQRAWSLLLERINGSDAPKQQEGVDVTLEVRRSTLLKG